MDVDVNTVMEPGEKIIWQGTINRKATYARLAIHILIILAISSIFFIMGTVDYTSNGQQKQISGFLVGGVILAFGISGSILNLWRKLITKYTVTQKRAIFQGGIIGTDFKSVYYDQIKNVVVDVGIMGKIFNVGTVKIDTGQITTTSSGGGHGPSSTTTKTVYDFMQDIEKPYEIYKYLQSSLSNRKESLYSGRADRESHPELYK